MYTRIFSPHRAAAVDIYWAYWDRPRSQSDEFHCRLFFRILENTDLTRASGDYPRGIPTYGSHGWKRIFEMRLADVPPGPRWRPIWERHWALEAADVARIHDVLFGDASQYPANLIDKISTVHLFFAAVGLWFHVARSDSEDEQDKLEEASSIHWTLSDNMDWFGLNIRKICGFQLARDANYMPPEHRYRW